jgi:predicted nucleic acid-binding protein
VVSASVLERFLGRHRRIGLDSNLLIYFIEAHPAYGALARKVFESIEAGRNAAVCSTVSLLEVLVQPYRTQNDEIVNRFYGLLTTYPHLHWVDLSIEVADLGARLRAEYELKTPDAVLLATALHSRATGFIGNDSKLKRVKGIEILMLS